MDHENGNALFLILIAVALFAALSYAVTQSARGGGDISREKREIAIAEMLGHFNLVRTATEKLIITGFCTSKSVRFWHQNRINTNTNHYGDELDTSCEVFHRDGGGAPFLKRPKAFADAGALGADEYMVLGLRIAGFGSDLGTADGDGQGTGHDLVIMANVDRQSCIQINNRFGIENPSGEPPHYTADEGEEFLSPGVGHMTFPSAVTGGYMLGGEILGDLSVRVAEVHGHANGCISRMNDGDRHYAAYSVLYVR